jgi:hypothetical protein
LRALAEVEERSDHERVQVEFRPPDEREEGAQNE